MDGVGGWTEIYFSFTPVDDENHLWLITSHVAVTGKEADAYRKKRAEYDRAVAAAAPVMDVVRDIWSGKQRFADVVHPDLAIVQDIAVQAGQGRIEDRAAERLGRSDAAHHPVAENSDAGIARHRRRPSGQALDAAADGCCANARVLIRVFMKQATPVRRLGAKASSCTAETRQALSPIVINGGVPRH